MGNLNPLCDPMARPGYSHFSPNSHFRRLVRKELTPHRSCHLSLRVHGAALADFRTHPLSSWLSSSPLVLLFSLLCFLWSLTVTPLIIPASNSSLCLVTSLLDHYPSQRHLSLAAPTLASPYLVFITYTCLCHNVSLLHPRLPHLKL